MTLGFRFRCALLALVAALTAAACGGGPTQPPPGVRQFTFVAPGGQTRIFYDPPQARGAIAGLSGPDLLDPRKTIGLVDFAGQVVVLNIWGTWCGPCRTEMPELQELHRMLGPQGVTVLGINVRDGRNAARDFLASSSITYPNIFDQPARSLLALNGFPRNTVPSTVVLDRRHRVAAVFLRAVLLSELAPLVQRVAAEEPRPNPADVP